MNGATPIETSFSYPGALLCCPHNMGQFSDRDALGASHPLFSCCGLTRLVTRPTRRVPGCRRPPAGPHRGLTPAFSLGCSSSSPGISSTACRSAASKVSSISPSTNSRWVSFRPVRWVSRYRWALIRWKRVSGIWKAIVLLLLDIIILPPFSFIS